MFWLSFRYLTKAPHPGGSAFSLEQADHIKKKWEEFGLDKVEMKKYEVLLSYPETPGIASIKSGDGSTLFTAQRKEKVLESSENDSNVLPPFNAYSSSGNVTVSMEVRSGLLQRATTLVQSGKVINMLRLHRSAIDLNVFSLITNQTGLTK